MCKQPEGCMRHCHFLEEAREKPVVAAGGIGNGQGIHKALSAGASAAALGTRFVATVESNAHPEYKRALLAAYAKDTALTICFQDGWPAADRALRNRTFVMWDAAGCPSPGKRPGEGDAIATKTDGSKILRYQFKSPLRGFGGAVTECPCQLVRALSSSKISLPQANWWSACGESMRLHEQCRFGVIESEMARGPLSMRGRLHQSRELRAFAPALVLLASCALINYVDRGNLSIAGLLAARICSTGGFHESSHYRYLRSSWRWQPFSPAAPFLNRNRSPNPGS